MNWILDPLHRVPPKSWAEVMRLNGDQVMAGYRSARNGGPCPVYASRSFWHGWRVGQVDFQGVAPDASLRAITAQYARYVEGVASLAELTAAAHREAN